jgi:hypothetical protein
MNDVTNKPVKKSTFAVPRRNPVDPEKAAEFLKGAERVEEGGAVSVLPSSLSASPVNPSASPVEKATLVVDSSAKKVEKQPWDGLNSTRRFSAIQMRLTEVELEKVKVASDHSKASSMHAFCLDAIMKAAELELANSKG